MRILAFANLFIFLLATACSTGESEESETPETSDPGINNDSYPSLLHEIWDAHGGIAPWQQQEALTFTLHRAAGPAETHHINLTDRKVLIESDSFQLGRDDSGVWVAPSLEAMDSNPVFYHNLVFYFYGIPFLMADPGVNHEDAGTRMLDGQSYRALNVSFDAGVGDASNDEYILLVDPETRQLRWLLYTVTYFANEKVTNYNALQYSDWVKTGDLVMPGKLSGYQYANDTLGAQRYEMTFSDVSFSEEPIPDNRFNKPENATYAED